MVSHLEVLQFWFGEPRGPRRKRWFEKDPAFDAAIRDRFLPLYEQLADLRIETTGRQVRAVAADVAQRLARRVAKKGSA